jgi:hypothetical protein
MKAKVSVMVLALLLLSFAGVRAEDGVGIGLILGEPTGISAKKWINHEHAVDAAAAWSFSENDSFQFHADYLFHDFGIFHSAAVGGRLPAYIGIGGRVKLEAHDGEKGRNEHDSLLGVRIPLGVSYILAKAPVEFFAEIVPILDIVPDTEFDLNMAVGARFYLR